MAVSDWATARTARPLPVLVTKNASAPEAEPENGRVIESSDQSAREPLLLRTLPGLEPLTWIF